MSYFMETMDNLLHQTAFFNLTVGNFIMILVACVFLYLAISKGFEPLLLVPIAFGMLLVNIYPDIFAEPEMMSNGVGGLFHYFYTLDEWSILPSLIFLWVGAMTDFGPLIANPISFLLGAAAQFGIFGAYFLAILLGFNDKAAAAVSIIGGADGPTSIFLAGIRTVRPDGTNRSGSVFLHGVSSYYPASDHEIIYNQKRACDQDGEPASGIKAGEDFIPYRGNNCGVSDPSYNSSTGWYVNAW